MSPSALFMRAALRPLSTASSATASSSFFLASSFAATRHMATARPVAAAAAAAAASKTALPKFSTASFLAAAFRRTSNRSGSHGGRRYQSSSAGADAGAGAQAHPNIFKRLWDSPVGVKTVHFWAPVLKWVLVLAGVSDFARPAEKLSVTQNIALTATGVIWTRWCLIIKPKNYMLAAVNFFLGIVGIIQCTRIVLHHQKVKSGEVEAPAAEAQQ